MIVIIDSNIIFSSLLSKNSKFRSILLNPAIDFYTPNFLISEIFKHKEKLIKNAKCTEEEVYEFLNKILQRIHFVNDELISFETANNAYELCKDIDEKDTPFIALVLEFNGSFWTGDNLLIKGLKAKGFNNFFEQ